MPSSINSRFRNSRPQGTRNTQGTQATQNSAKPAPTNSQPAGSSGSRGDSVTLSSEAQELATFIPISPNGGGCDSTDWRCLERVLQG
ncbi:MAG TPA: hypothetical protein EYO33_31145 [Phycisphaerales bacterium]|nr:hypothetical protein [Phycisphaerales bacterium]